ncbi:hypothetical protein WA158_004690 [Blastocystis sp. Blastoise]
MNEDIKPRQDSMTGSVADQFKEIYSSFRDEYDSLFMQKETLLRQPSGTKNESMFIHKLNKLFERYRNEFDYFERKSVYRFGSFHSAGIDDRFSRSNDSSPEAKDMNMAPTPMSCAVSKSTDFPFELYGYDQQDANTKTFYTQPIVLIKVGQYNIAVPKKCFNKYPDSYLCEIIMKHYNYQDGVYHLIDDPHPIYFKEIIHYLLTNEMLSVSYTEEEKEFLIEEFSHYEIPLSDFLIKYLWKKRRHMLYKHYHAGIPLYFRVHDTVYSLTEEQAMKYDNEYFVDYLLRNKNQEVDEYNHILLDPECNYYIYIFEYLQTGNITLEQTDNEKISQIQEEFFKFHISVPLDLWKSIYTRIKEHTPSSLFPDSALLSDVSSSSIHLLSLWLGASKQWKNIYRVSSDGIHMSNVHQLIDGMKDILYIIRGNHGYIFGAYTHIGFKCSSFNEFVEDPYAFLFTLKNPSNHPKRFICQKPEIALLHHNNPDYFGIFGSSEFVIKRFNDDLVVGNINIDGNKCYIDDTKLLKNDINDYYTYILGDSEEMLDFNFIVDDMEIFTVTE